MDIVIDFDGTCVTHDFPKIGKDIGAVPVLLDLVKNGHRLILFTMRSNLDSVTSDDETIIAEPGNYLMQALTWFKHHNIPLWGIQRNPNQDTWTTSPKAYGQLYIDDAGIGCPLISDPSFHSRPYVNWIEIREILTQKGLIK